MIDIQVIDVTDSIKKVLMCKNVIISPFDDDVKALIYAEQKQPTIVLLNFNVRHEQTAQYINLILKVSSQSKIIVLSDQLNEEQILACLIAGAKGYQNLENFELYADKLIRVVNAGEAWVSRQMVATILDAFRLKTTHFSQN